MYLCFHYKGKDFSKTHLSSLMAVFYFIILFWTERSYGDMTPLNAFFSEEKQTDLPVKKSRAINCCTKEDQ